jgi:hypothetical protein
VFLSLWLTYRRNYKSWAQPSWFCGVQQGSHFDLHGATRSLIQVRRFSLMLKGVKNSKFWYIVCGGYFKWVWRYTPMILNNFFNIGIPKKPWKITLANRVHIESWWNTAEYELGLDFINHFLAQRQDYFQEYGRRMGKHKLGMRLITEESVNNVLLLTYFNNYFFIIHSIKNYTSRKIIEKCLE